MPQDIFIVPGAGVAPDAAAHEWFLTWLVGLDEKQNERRTRLTPAQVELHFMVETAKIDDNAAIKNVLTLRMSYLTLAGLHGWKPSQALLQMGVNINSKVLVATALSSLRMTQPELFRTADKKKSKNAFKGDRGIRGGRWGRGPRNYIQYQGPPSRNY